MLGKRPAPVIGKLTNSFISSNRAGLVEVATSPRSPLDFKIQSPRGLKNYDLGGVGLGIVAALEKSPDVVGCEIQANKSLYNRNLNRSNPIPVISAKNSCTSRRDGGDFEEMEMDSLEEYTLVTCRRPGNKSYTKVYYDGGEHSRKGHERTEFDRRNSKTNRPSVFDISPARFGESIALPPSDFLSSCHWCQKKLHGKDIYMYRGEKAFCSTECRHRQIVMDEHKEKCSSVVSRSAEVPSSPCKNGQIFSPGIFAI